MKREVNKFIGVLVKATDKLVNEYDELVSQMQSHDVATFTTNLHSEYSYYSLRYFDEERFIENMKHGYNIDLTNATVKELTSDSVRNYTDAYISLEALREHFRTMDAEGVRYAE